MGDVTLAQRYHQAFKEKLTLPQEEIDAVLAQHKDVETDYPDILNELHIRQTTGLSGKFVQEYWIDVFRNVWAFHHPNQKFRDDYLGICMWVAKSKVHGEAFTAAGWSNKWIADRAAMLAAGYALDGTNPYVGPKNWNNELYAFIMEHVEEAYNSSNFQLPLDKARTESELLAVAGFRQLLDFNGLEYVYLNKGLIAMHLAAREIEIWNKEHPKPTEKKIPMPPLPPCMSPKHTPLYAAYKAAKMADINAEESVFDQVYEHDKSLAQGLRYGDVSFMLKHMPSIVDALR